MQDKTKFKQTEIGMIPEDWEIEKIDNLFEISSGLSKPRNEFGFGHPFLSFKNIFDNISLPKELYELVNSSERERKHCSIMRGDVFLTRTSETIGELGMSSVALKNYENATFNGFAKRLRPKRKDIILPEFAVYLFRSSKIRSQILTFSSLTTRASLNAGMIKEIKLIIPSLPEQSAIANILSPLDNRIDLNRQTNATLEAVGQALFKHWFIDFEFPNEKGNPYKSSGGEMIDSELGEIPKGWTVGRLGDICDITMGQSPPGNTYNELGDGLPFYQGITDFGFRFPSRRVYCTEPTRFAEADDVLLSVRAPVGSLNVAEERCAIGRGVASLRLKGKRNGFLYYLLRATRSGWEMFEAEGTVFGSVTKSDVHDFKVIIPPRALIERFAFLISPWDKTISNKEKQSRTLTAVRDSLLPKLMSGKIRVCVGGAA
jgi:type I restriction enzyme S subunit